MLALQALAPHWASSAWRVYRHKLAATMRDSTLTFAILRFGWYIAK